jgi:hypothetical protein
VLSTQVLEHVAEPSAVAAELYRVLVPEGRLYMTVPLVWELHEQPFDFYRYTPSGLEHLLRKAGFAGIKVRPRNDCFSTLAQLLRNVGAVMGRRPDGLDPKRDAAAAELARMADVVAAYAPLDADWILPLGYSVTAVRPASRGVTGARSLAVLAFGRELTENPELLASYARVFGAEDDATLVVYAPDVDPALLEQAGATAGLDGEDSADVLVLAGKIDERLLADNVRALLSRQPAAPPFTALPRFEDASVAGLRELASA